MLQQNISISKIKNLSPEPFPKVKKPALIKGWEKMIAH